MRQRTVLELENLIKVKDGQISQVQESAKKFDDAWQKKDGRARDKWVKDWLAFVGRYRSARSLGEVAIKRAGKMTTKPAEAEFSRIHELVKAEFGPLYERLTKARLIVGRKAA